MTELWRWPCEVHGGYGGIATSKPTQKPTECGITWTTAHFGANGKWEPMPREDEPCQMADEPVRLGFVSG